MHKHTFQHKAITTMTRKGVQLRPLRQTVSRGGLLGLPTRRPSALGARQGSEKLRRSRNTKEKEGMPKEWDEGWRR